MLGFRSLISVSAVGVRGLLIAIAASSLLIAGLLAMHSLNLDSDHASGGMAMPTVAVGHHSEAPGTMRPVALEECYSGCGGEDRGMSMVVCILVLMAASLVLHVPLVRAWGLSALFPGALMRGVAGGSRPLRPPSLVVLSISRT